MAARKATGKASDAEAMTDFKRGAREVDDVEVSSFLHQTRLPYAYSVIQDRALVDAVGGLKPVQRRILYSMFENGVLPSKPTVKVLRLVGNATKYHPHGDASVGDALCRMAQPYSLRVPLIHGEGHFGAHPGDAPAKPRYVEASLNRAAVELLADLKLGAGVMVDNYDGSAKEPAYLPGRWPVALINGCNGVAVGYATNMPQHNPTEAIAACRLLLRKPNASIREIMRVMPGPDFWTGGVVLGVDGIREYYETGHGTFQVRSKYRVEYSQRGRSKIVYYELPPGVSVVSVIEKVNSLRKTDALCKGISSVKNLTDRHNTYDVKFQIETKPGVNVEALIATLFKYTPLQQGFAVNNTVLVDGRPVQVSVRELIQQFLGMRERSVTERTKTALKAKQKRAEMVDGLLSIIVDIDKAISIIRHSETVDTARRKLMASFGINEEQANFVLQMQLRQLTRQDSLTLKQEKKELAETIAELNRILTDRKEFLKVIDEELAGEVKIIGDKRHMEISGLTADEAAEMARQEMKSARDNLKDRPCYVSVMPGGNVIKTGVRVSPLAQAHVGTKDITPMLAGWKTSRQGTMYAIGSDGVAYDLPVGSLPEDKPVTLRSLRLTGDGVEPVGVVPGGKSEVMAVTAMGKYRRISLDMKDGVGGKPIMRLGAGDSLVALIDTGIAVRGSTVVIVTKLGKALRFDYKDSAPVGMGSGLIQGMRLSKGDAVAAADILRKDAANLITLSKRSVKSTSVSEIPIQGRGTGGAVIHKVDARDPIIAAGGDAVLVRRNTVIAAPAPSPKGGRFAPAMGISLSR